MKYFSVRKVKWDMLWHGLYFDSFGREKYNRITKQSALRWIKTRTLKYD